MTFLICTSVFSLLILCLSVWMAGRGGPPLRVLAVFLTAASVAVLGVAVMSRMKASWSLERELDLGTQKADFDFHTKNTVWLPMQRIIADIDNTLDRGDVDAATKKVDLLRARWRFPSSPNTSPASYEDEILGIGAQP